MKNTDSTGIFFYNPSGLLPDPLDYPELARYALEFPNVARIWQYVDFPWNEENIIKKIEAHNLDRLIIAGALPGTVKTPVLKSHGIGGKRSAKSSFGEFQCIWNLCHK